MHAPHQGSRTFPRMPVLIVLSIVAMLVLLTHQEIVSGESNTSRALTDVELLAAAARLFEKSNGRIPSTEELVDGEPADSPLRDLVEDPWGNAYEIEGMTVTCFEVVSAGPDGLFDTGDDIRSRRSGER